MTATTTSTSFEDLFIDGFCAVSPEGYDAEGDFNSPDPWCCPWNWADMRDWFNANLSPYDMGKAWGEACFDDLEKVLEEEASREETEE